MHGPQKEGLQVLTLAEMKFNQGVFASGTAAWPPCCCGTQNKELLPTRTGTSHRNREPPDYSTSVFHRQEQARHTNCIFLIMAPGQKAYPRGTVKKIVKAHSNCNLSKNVDVMIYLDYVLFMQTLVKEAAIESKKSGEKGITARSVQKVTSDTLTKFRG
ncbi:hypothetical protein CH63R_10896 [Colletotrichum higginsianum IMI 349063]|uniref:Transcription factor CBF/NF-Y/archaeal histone domain-containing protein n=3 Tax=Colletotrichum higginsianum TaxID=80884 RepID=A0A1B7Y454_COLHI|nr:uncharacterized protein CH63R_10896 [Colletotrichum higginsianum IMI 349063]OBR06776.1 hypothetical protein CH63R_10896 [Colletotrichum higginsianum IMI 349063]